jgi:hypothetical protein
VHHAKVHLHEGMIITRLQSRVHLVVKQFTPYTFVAMKCCHDPSSWIAQPSIVGVTVCTFY